MSDSDKFSNEALEIQIELEWREEFQYANGDKYTGQWIKDTQTK